MLPPGHSPLRHVFNEWSWGAGIGFVRFSSVNEFDLTANRVVGNSQIWTILDGGAISSELAATLLDGSGPAAGSPGFQLIWVPGLLPNKISSLGILGKDPSALSQLDVDTGHRKGG